MIRPSTARRFLQHGFTVVEIMVAMVISLLLLAGIMTLFANSRTAYESNDRLARIQENGRLALDLIARDLRGAGNWGCAKRTADRPLVNRLNSSTGLLWNFGIPVQGFNANGTSWSPALLTPASTDRADSDGTGPDVDGPAPGSDVLVIRGPKRDSSPQRLQANTTGTSVVAYQPSGGFVAGDIAIAASCDRASVFQVAGVSAASGLETLTVSDAAATPGNQSLSLGNPFYANQAEVFPVQTVVYFVDTSQFAPAPGVRSTSLWRRAGNNAPEEVVEGIDSFQASFGVDTNGDKLADVYQTADAVTNWDEVVSVRVALLARSLTPYGSDTDATARTLLGQSIPAFNDRYQRLVFTTTMTLRNRVF